MSEEKIPSQQDEQVSQVRDSFAKGVRLLSGGERHPAGASIPLGGMKQSGLEGEGARQNMAPTPKSNTVVEMTIEHSTNRLTNQETP
jgi:hypothetical protein